MGKSQIPFCGSTYEGRSPNISASRAVNLYPEVGSPNEDGKAQIAMVGTPGLAKWAIGISGDLYSTVRSMTTFNGVLYAVIGNKLYSVDSTGGGTNRGTLSTSTGRVMFANNGATAGGVGGNELALIDGTNLYLYNINTTAFTTPTVGFSNADQVEYQDGYFIATNGTMTYYVSALYDGHTAWPGLAYASVLATPDPIVTVVSHRQQLYFLKTQSTEVWYNAGTPTSSGSPFNRVSGGVYDYGCAAKWSAAKGGDSFFFLCTQRTQFAGELVGVAMVTDYAPQIVSTPPIAYKINQSTTLNNCFGYCYADSGHMFYVLTNPDDNWTLVFDSTTGMWHERSSLASDANTVNRHLGNCYAYAYGKHLVGDYRNGLVYEMNSAYYSDAGFDIWSFRTAPLLFDNQMLDNLFINRIIIDMETGVGTAPVLTPTTAYQFGFTGTVNILWKYDGTITYGAGQTGYLGPLAWLSWSDDSGHTWSTEYSAEVGNAPEYGTRLMWRRIGRARNRVFKVRISNPIPKVLLGAYVEGSK